MKNKFLILFSLILLSSIISVAAVDINSCSNISSSGFYNLTTNLYPDGTINPCININASNIVFDCLGNSITNSSSNINAINIVNSTNVTIKNCVLAVNYSGLNYAIKLDNVNYSTIYNNTITSANGAIYIDGTLGSSFNNIINNNLIGASSSSIINGIYLMSANNIQNNISYNNIINNSNVGIYDQNGKNNFIIGNNVSYSTIGMVLGDVNNYIKDTIIYNCSASTGCFLLFSGAQNNTIENLLLYNYYGPGLMFGGYSTQNPKNNLFKNIVITNSTSSLDIKFGGNSGTNNTFVNCTYNSSKESVAAGSQFTRAWYYQGFVNGSDGTNLSATLNIYNSSGSNIFTLPTTNGYTQQIYLTDYVNNGTKNYYSNYTINASYDSLAIISHNINITSLMNYLDIFTFDIPAPTTGGSGGGGSPGITGNIESLPLKLYIHYYKDGAELPSYLENQYFEAFSFDLVATNPDSDLINISLNDLSPSRLTNYVEYTSISIPKGDTLLFKSKIIPTTEFLNQTNMTFHIAVAGKGSDGRLLFGEVLKTISLGKNNNSNDALQSIGNKINPSNPKLGIFIFFVIIVIILFVIWSMSKS